MPLLDQGGLERVCANTGQLLKNEYEVYIAVFNSKGMIYDVSGVTLIDLGLGAVEGGFSKMLQVVKRGRKLTKLQKQLNIDVCYSFGRTANLANALIKGRAKKLAACHSFGEIQNARAMKFIIGRMDKVICCAKAMTKEVYERYDVEPDKVVTVWNPCDIDGIRKQGDEKLPREYRKFFEASDFTSKKNADKIIVSMGREDDVKGFWHLLKAFKRVNEKLPNTKLAIIGEGSFIEYRKMAEDMKISERVLFAGLQLNPFPFLKAGSVYVLSSLSEGLPNALVETLAMEVPIVSVNCKSGPAEILSIDWEKAAKGDGIIHADYGILTSRLQAQKNTLCEYHNEAIKLEASEENLASAIMEMLENEKLYEKYKANSLKRAMEFSSANYKDNIIRIIDTIV